MSPELNSDEIGHSYSDSLHHAGTSIMVCFILGHDPSCGCSPEGSRCKTSEADFSMITRHASEAFDYFFNSATGKMLKV